MPNNITSYKTVAADTNDDLDRQVGALIDQGYQPAQDLIVRMGSVSVGKPVVLYVQVMALHSNAL